MRRRRRRSPRARRSPRRRARRSAEKRCVVRRVPVDKADLSQCQNCERNDLECVRTKSKRGSACRNCQAKHLSCVWPSAGELVGSSALLEALGRIEAQLERTNHLLLGIGRNTLDQWPAERFETPEGERAGPERGFDAEATFKAERERRRLYLASRGLVMSEDESGEIMGGDQWIGYDGAVLEEDKTEPEEKEDEEEEEEGDGMEQEPEEEA